MTTTKTLEKMHISHMEMPAIEKYLDDDIEFRNDLGKWAERNYNTIKQALTANTWRDIKDAPRDGTYVIACDGSKKPEIASFRYGCWDIRDQEDIEFRPTHWQPLPKPPKDK